MSLSLLLWARARVCACMRAARYRHKSCGLCFRRRSAVLNTNACAHTQTRAHARAPPESTRRNAEDGDPADMAVAVAEAVVQEEEQRSAVETKVFTETHPTFITGKRQRRGGDSNAKEGSTSSAALQFHEKAHTTSHARKRSQTLGFYTLILKLSHNLVSDRR